MPKDLEGASTHMKLWSVWMYERATKTRLIPGGIDYLDLLKSMDELLPLVYMNFAAPCLILQQIRENMMRKL